MPPRGRKPTPNAQKKARGTDQPCRMRDNTVEFPVVRDPADPPEYVDAPDAIAFWRKFEPLLRTQRVLTEADVEPLAHLCNLHGRLVRLWRLGETPPVAMIREFRTYCAEFGLTPSSRMRVPRSDAGKTSNAFGRLAGDG